MRLGIDFGTSHTVAVLSRSDGRAEALLFDSSPLLPSAVFAEPGGGLLAGRDAERSARVDPASYEPHPKRRIDDVAVLLGDREVLVVELVEAVLRRVAEEATRVLGQPPGTTVLTHPADWGPRRRALLRDAAARAGLPAAGLVAEPVAAAMYFTTVLEHHVPDGHAIVVYDFGGGTFDISVVRRAGAAWLVAAAQGLDEVGGIDLDAAIVGWVAGQVADRDLALWRRLDNPAGPADRRHRRALWEDARSAKELLSRATSAGIAVPLFDADLHLTRAEFESLARPWLDRTVALTTATLFTSGVTADRLAGVFLVGGGSRVPLVATLLHRALGVAPVILEQPELVVGLGSLLAPAAEDRAPVPPVTLQAGPAAPLVASPVPAPLFPPVPAEGLPVAPPAFAVAPAAAAGQLAEPGDTEVPGTALPGERQPSVPGPTAAVSRPSATDRRRRRVDWLLVALTAVVALGLLGVLLNDRVSSPPVFSGFFAPLTPKPVTMLLAMTLAVAATGRPSVPAYRALGPALLATAGALIALLLVVLLSGPTPDTFSYFSPTGQWIFTVLAAVLSLGGIALLARHRQVDAVDVIAMPTAAKARWAWAGLWAAGGAALLAGTISPLSYNQYFFTGNSGADVSPGVGAFASGGSPYWYAAFTLGLLTTIGPWLLAGAALRPLFARSAVLRTAARALILAAGAAALMLTFLERAYVDGGTSVIYRVSGFYWDDQIGVGSYQGHVHVDLILALAISLGVAISSYLHARRARGIAPPAPKGV